MIVKDNRIISIGYNGTPAGYVNCDEVFDKNNFNVETHHKFSSKFEVHAEMNAILYALKNGSKLDG